MRGGVKASRAVQHIAKEVQPHRPALARRKNVNDTAPYGVIARLRHRIALRKPHADEEVAQRSLVDPLAHPCAERRFAQHLTRRNSLRDRIDGGEQDEPLGAAMHQPGERRHSRRRNVSVRRDAIIRQTIPGRKRQDRHAGVEEAQRIRHARHALVIQRDVDDRTFAPRDLGQDEGGIEPFGRTPKGYLV